MKTSPFKGLVIRTAVVLGNRYGFIYACDPKREARDDPHTYVFVWDDGKAERGDCNYNAHSVCVIDRPAQGMVDVSEAGYYTVDTEDDRVTQDIFESSAPAPKKRRTGGIRSVHEIGGLAHAVGIRGMVYRLDALDRWTRIDQGLPETFDVQAIHGAKPSALYAVGFKGEVWFYDSTKWHRQELETNRNLTSVKCAPDGTVYIGGHGGMLIHGQRDAWLVIEHGDTEEDIWDLEWFGGILYVSTLDGLFTLEQGHLRPVKFGKQAPRSTYQLSAADDVMWSNGEFEIMQFDGVNWTRIV